MLNTATGNENMKNTFIFVKNESPKQQSKHDQFKLVQLPIAWTTINLKTNYSLFLAGVFPINLAYVTVSLRVCDSFLSALLIFIDSCFGQTHKEAFEMICAIPFLHAFYLHAVLSDSLLP